MSSNFNARFEAALRQFDIGTDDRILLAVSGGPDSLALLLLAQSTLPGRIVAATVDHGLRAEASEEAAYVARICSDLHIPHLTLHPATPITGNIQSSARTARYALLEQAMEARACTHIATAHHGDDQLETLLMRLARGSGVNGMAGIRPLNGQIIRPLLGFAKTELEGICATAGLKPIRDPSNDDSDFDRVAMRQWLAGSKHPFDLARAQRTASAMRESSEALAWTTDRLASERVARNGEVIELDPGALPADLQRRLLIHCIALCDPILVSKGEAIGRLLADLTAGKTATIGNILCRGGTIWQFSPAPPRRA